MTAPAPPLALGSGERPRPRNVLNLAILIVVTGGMALFATLIAAYAGLARFAGPWPPEGVRIDDYVGQHADPHGHHERDHRGVGLATPSSGTTRPRPRGDWA